MFTWQRYGYLIYTTSDFNKQGNCFNKRHDGDIPFAQWVSTSFASALR